MAGVVIQHQVAFQLMPTLEAVAEVLEIIQAV
jgi:hypothetical protein